MKNYTFIFSFIGLLIVVSASTLLNGETPWNRVWEGIQQRLQGTSSAWNPLLDERLPRLIVLLCTGASLATSGAVMQSLFQNPLASPSILGITMGGNVCAIIILISGLTLHLPFLLPVSAVAGSLITLFLVYWISRMSNGHSLNTLILIGVAISTIFAAIHSLLLYAFRDQWQLMQAITEWEAGSSLDRQWSHVHMQLPLTLIGLIGCWIYREELNLLSLGEEEALHLGVDVKKVRWRLFLSVSLLTGGTLAAMGIIPFFGLMLPHLMRMLKGSNHQSLIPLCIGGGAIGLTALDNGLRFFSIHLISVGNSSALIGGIFFLILFLKSRTRWPQEGH